MNNPLIIGLLLIIAALSFLLLRQWWKKISKQQDMHDRLERGAIKEAEAQELLKKWGYTIEASQKRIRHEFRYGGEKISVPLILDYVVSKNEKTYVVEVKSGKSAADIYNAATRRQVLEYYHSVSADGFYLLNMEKHEMKKLVFYSKNE